MTIYLIVILWATQPIMELETFDSMAHCEAAVDRMTELDVIPDLIRVFCVSKEAE